MKRVVCDTGPLLHLREADLLYLLPLMGELCVPPGVERETKALVRNWTSQRPEWLQLVSLDERATAEAHHWLAAGFIHAGEAEAIALSRQLRADWFLTDDAKARWIAGREGIEVHGSLGVVLWAAATGRLTHQAADEGLARLATSSLWISSSVLAEAREALRRFAEPLQ